MATGVEFSEKLGRRIRRDGFDSIGEHTLTLLEKAIDEGRAADAKELLDFWKWEYAFVNDIFVDWTWAIFTFIAQRHGEEEVEQALRETMGTWFSTRYGEVWEKLTPEERAQVMVESMRVHPVGPGRFGGFKVVDEGDRWVMEFDGCGSGQAARRGHESEGMGKGPRTEAPYGYGVSSKPHDWTFGQKDVPWYCAHCAMVEVLTTETYGYPFRITDFNADPSAPCKWIVYKDKKDIPEEYFRRMGKEKPVVQIDR